MDLPLMEGKSCLAPIHHLPPRCSERIGGHPLAGTITGFGNNITKMEFQVFGTAEQHFPHRADLCPIQILKDRVIKENILAVTV